MFCLTSSFVLFVVLTTPATGAALTPQKAAASSSQVSAKSTEQQALQNGEQALQKGDVARARSEFEKAVRLAPNDAAAQSALG